MITETIGFIGLGAMGLPMTLHLAGLGYTMLVHDLDARALQSAVEAGARAASSARQVADEARIVLTCLPSLPALRAVALGQEGLIAGESIEILVDFSTTGADFARELAEALSPRGIALMDSPITGSVVTAGNGKLGIMCSGPSAAFQRVEPVLRDLASAIVLYLGDQTGRAQTLKLLNNLLSATGMAISCEAFILGTKAGLDPQTMLDIINAGDASSSASRNKFPRSVLTRQFDYGARMAITAKDTSLTVREAEELGVPMWIGQAVRQVWRYAVSQGGADRDGTSLITFLEPWAGVVVAAAAQAPAPATEMPRRDERSHWVLVGNAATMAALKPRLLAFDTAGAATSLVTSLTVPDGSGAHAVLAALPPRDVLPRTIINLCPMPAEQAAELAQANGRIGDDYLEVLPLGPVRDIGQPTSIVLAAGERRTLDGAKGLLDLIGGRTMIVSGRPGDAQLMQQIHESVFATLLAATCEAYVAGAKAGLDPLQMTRIMGVETGRNAASARLIPEQVATRRFDHGRTIGELQRALTLAGAAAQRLGVTPWILDKSRLLYGLAAQLQDPGADATRLITHYEAWARTEVRAGLPTA